MILTCRSIPRTRSGGVFLIHLFPQLWAFVLLEFLCHYRESNFNLGFSQDCAHRSLLSLDYCTHRKSGKRQYLCRIGRICLSQKYKTKGDCTLFTKHPWLRMIVARQYRQRPQTIVNSVFYVSFRFLEWFRCISWGDVSQLLISPSVLTTFVLKLLISIHMVILSVFVLEWLEYLSCRYFHWLVQVGWEIFCRLINSIHPFRFL